MATLEQERAAFALEKVDSIKGGREKSKYKTQLLKLPARLHNNGLGQTVAFYLSAGTGKPEVAICGWIEEWLLQREIYERRPLIEAITGARNSGIQPDRVEPLYRQASAEVRALAVWLKRFAEAFIEGEEEPK
jgi:CRISPR type III-B/RAMP module-associated protein Cmr5